MVALTARAVLVARAGAEPSADVEPGGDPVQHEPRREVRPAERELACGGEDDQDRVEGEPQPVQLGAAQDRGPGRGEARDMNQTGAGGARTKSDRARAGDVHRRILRVASRRDDTRQVDHGISTTKCLRKGRRLESRRDYDDVAPLRGCYFGSPEHQMDVTVDIRRGRGPDPERRVALVEEPQLRLVGEGDSVYALAMAAISSGCNLMGLVGRHATDETLEYDPIYRGKSDWRLLPPIDQPAEPARCLVSGTGLTHLGSAKDRQAMHEMKETELTDSMRMFRWGVEGGRPEPGKIGRRPGSTNR